MQTFRRMCGTLLRRISLTSATALWIVGVGCSVGDAASFKVVYSFCDPNKCLQGGLNGQLIMDSKGNFFGTTSGGIGDQLPGAVFELTPNADRSHWIETILTFTNTYGIGGGLESPLAEDAEGRVYGTTNNYGGPNGFGSGTLFQLSPNPGNPAAEWNASVLYAFGTAPVEAYDAQGGLIIDRSGNFYGTTALGGPAGGGVVYELSPLNDRKTEWSIEDLHNFYFNSLDVSPVAGLIMDKRGNLYGTTSGGINCGAVFQLTPSGTETVLHSFANSPPILHNGCHPIASLIMDASGNLYGTTVVGGVDNNGTVFEVMPNATKTEWSERVLYSFCSRSGCPDGANPMAGLVMDATGRLYGVTPSAGVFGAGTVFELIPNQAKSEWTEKVLHHFCRDISRCVDGYTPTGGLVMGGFGNLYGMTAAGGAFGGGAVFELRP
jgi:uncharacterized repeat protein (TIGR03803 family)